MDADACNMVLNWEVLATNERYTALYDEVRARFETDAAFQSECIEASRWVLERRVPEGMNLTQEMLKSAVRYLLTEIPLFLDAAGIVGKEASVFCYHQRVQFLDDLFNRRLLMRPALGQGFVIIEPIYSEVSATQQTSFNNAETQHIPTNESDYRLS